MDAKYDADHPRNLIPEWCRHFYNLGWMTGTGGALSIRHGSEIYITPSAIEKERILPEDLIVQTIEQDIVSEPPPSKKLKRSTCTPHFMNAYRLRDAGCVMHLHTKAAVMATLLCPGTEFRVSKLQMVKGMRNDVTGKYLDFDDTLVVPIVENAQTELDLEEPVLRAMKAYPEACAVLIRGHGLYIWGPTARATKCMLEAFDYVLDISIQMKQAGLDPEHHPDYPEGAIVARPMLDKLKK